MINWTLNKYKFLNENYASHMKIVRYIISGCTAAFTDLVALYIFTDIFGIWYIISTPLAFVIAFGVSFGMQKYWTFRDHSSGNVGKQGMVYFVVSLTNLFVNTFLVFAFTEWVGFHYMFSQFLAGGLIAISSFFIYQKLIFNQSKIKEVGFEQK